MPYGVLQSAMASTCSRISARSLSWLVSPWLCESREAIPLCDIEPIFSTLMLMDPSDLSRLPACLAKAADMTTKVQRQSLNLQALMGG